MYLHQVDPNLFASAVLTPKQLILQLPDSDYLKPALTDEQVLAFISAASNLKDSKIISVEMALVTISHVDHNLLEDFLNTGVKVTLVDCRYNDEHQYELIKNRAIVIQHDMDELGFIKYGAMRKILKIQKY